MTCNILKLVAAAFIIILGGCASKVFVHDTKNSEQFEKDKYDCKIVATQYSADLGVAGHPAIIRNEMNKCLTIKHGWREQGKTD